MEMRAVDGVSAGEWNGFQRGEDEAVGRDEATWRAGEYAGTGASG